MWMPHNLSDDWLTLVQVIACCHQAPCHYLGQCWPRSMAPFDITRPQCIKARISCHCISKLLHDSITMFYDQSMSFVKLWYYCYIVFIEILLRWVSGFCIYDRTLLIHIVGFVDMAASHNLNHCGLVTPCGNIDLGEHGSWNSLVPDSA